METSVDLDGRPHRVGLMLAEDTKGNLFDNLNADVDAWAQKNGSSKLPANSRAGESEPLYHSANAPDGATIGLDTAAVKADGLNMTLFDDGQSAASHARGAYVLRQDDAALIALFKGKADVSTVIHEGAGHFFLENLREAAQRPDAPGWVTDGWRTVAQAIDADYAGVGWGLLDPQRCIL